MRDEDALCDFAVHLIDVLFNDVQDSTLKQN